MCIIKTDDLKDSFQRGLAKGYDVVEASNISSEQLSTRTLELNQKNFVSYNGEVESTIVEKKSLNKILSLCENANKRNVANADVLLSVSSLFAGAFLSAIISGVSFSLSFKCILFYIVSPAAAVGCGVAYGFIRKIDQISEENLTNRIKELLSEMKVEQVGERGENDES